MKNVFKIIAQFVSDIPTIIKTITTLILKCRRPKASASSSKPEEIKKKPETLN